MENFKKNDLILIFILIALGLGLFIFMLCTSKTGAKVMVSVDGKETASYSLTEDGSHEISGVNGGTNLLVIENGQALMKDASCPDHLCVNMGKISKDGQSIVCLPNKVVVEVVSDDSADVDVMAY